MQNARDLSIYDIFCLLAERPRRGWVMRDIEHPETTYTHSLEMKQMALFYGRQIKGLNVFRAAEMCMAHDITDTVAPDVTPHEGVTKAEKKKIERHGLWQLLQRVKLRDFGKMLHIAQLWLDYENSKTPEAKFVRELNSLQLAQKTLEYELTQGKNMPDMWASAEKGIHTPLLKFAFNDMIACRPEGIEARPLTQPHPLTPAQEHAAITTAAEHFNALNNGDATSKLLFERFGAFNNYHKLNSVGGWLRTLPLRTPFGGAFLQMT